MSSKPNDAESTPGLTPGLTPTRPRLPWIDGARSLALVLVVLFHTVIGHYYLLPDAGMPYVKIWDSIGQTLSAIRLPLLFACSGLLAAGKIRSGLSGKTLSSILTTYWLYVVWFLLFMGFLTLLPSDYDKPHVVTSTYSLFSQLWAPNTYLWYLFALAIYTVVFAALRRIPWLLIFGGTLVLHLWSSWVWNMESPLWTRVFVYAFFFAAGLYGKELLSRLVTRRWFLGVTTLIALILVENVDRHTIVALEKTPAEDRTLLAMYLFAGAAAMSWSYWLTKLHGFDRLARFIGARNLVIYVLHVPVITLLNLLALGPLAGILSGMLSVSSVHLLYPLLATSIVVLLCCLGHGILRLLPSSLGVMGTPGFLRKLLVK